MFLSIYFFLFKYSLSAFASSSSTSALYLIEFRAFSPVRALRTSWEMLFSTLSKLLYIYLTRILLFQRLSYAGRPILFFSIVGPHCHTVFYFIRIQHPTVYRSSPLPAHTIIYLLFHTCVLFRQNSVHFSRHRLLADSFLCRPNRRIDNARGPTIKRYSVFSTG